jgi:hypothetical protein
VISEECEACRRARRAPGPVNKCMEHMTWGDCDPFDEVETEKIDRPNPWPFYLLLFTISMIVGAGLGIWVMYTLPG